MDELSTNIKTLLVPKDEIKKKQVALFLPPKKIEKLDNLVKELSMYSNGKVNRNALIEMAIDNLMKTIPKVIEDYEADYEDDVKIEKDFDTIICPSQEDGEDFLNNFKRWEYVKVSKNKLNKIKYLALYISAPKSAIVCYTKVVNYEEVIIQNIKKYRLYIDKDIIYLENPIKLGNASPLLVRSPKYCLLQDLLKSSEIKDII